MQVNIAARYFRYMLGDRTGTYSETLELLQGRTGKKQSHPDASDHIVFETFVTDMQSTRSRLISGVSHDLSHVEKFLLLCIISAGHCN